MANPILTKTSKEKISSPEQLNDYIKVSNAGVWLVLGVVIILMISLLVWSVVGHLNTSVKAIGVAEDGKITCYLTSVGNIDKGDAVRVEGISGEVVSVSKKPISSADVSKKYDEYTVYQLHLSDWNYEVVIKADGCSDEVKTVSIISDSVSPISFITG
ncbi:MAG: hypothetical protein IJV39_00525 [Ruminococcus sp.]|nr:hypothetical protein [Ruminococcus sp.]